MLACVEMARSGVAEAADGGVGAVEALLRRQVTGGPLRGALRSGPETDSDLFRHAWLSGVPALALLEAMAAGLGDANHDVLAYMAFPLEHWRQIPPPTRWNVSTARLGEGSMSSGSSRTGRP